MDVRTPKGGRSSCEQVPTLNATHDRDARPPFGREVSGAFLNPCSIHSSQTLPGLSSFSRSPHTICTRWHHTRSGDSSAGWPFIASCDRECRGREKGLHALCRRPPFSAPCPSLRVNGSLISHCHSPHDGRTRSCALASLPQDRQPTTTLRTSALARTERSRTAKKLRKTCSILITMQWHSRRQLHAQASRA